MNFLFLKMKKKMLFRRLPAGYPPPPTREEALSGSKLQSRFEKILDGKLGNERKLGNYVETEECGELIMGKNDVENHIQNIFSEVANLLKTA